MVSFLLVEHLLRGIGSRMKVESLCLEVDFVLGIAWSMMVGVDLRKAVGHG